MEDPLLFVLAVLTILGTPGPTNTLLATSGAAAGARASLALVQAEAAGYLIAILTLGLVLGPVVAASPLLATGLRLAVGSYLLLLAVRLWRRGGAALVEGGVVTPRQVFTTTLLNPKALVFALGVVPFGERARTCTCWASSGCWSRWPSAGSPPARRSAGRRLARGGPAWCRG